MCYHPEEIEGLTEAEARLGQAAQSRRMHREMWEAAVLSGGPRTPASRAWRAHIHQHKAQAARVRDARAK